MLERFADKMTGRWHEGAEPPARLANYVADFARRYPDATRHEWVMFATKLADECYAAGFRRGFEHAERDPEPGFRRLPPELLADQEDPGWRHPSRRIDDTDMSPPFDRYPDEDDGIPIELEDGKEEP